MHFWNEINGIGRLYTEIELVVSTETVLFVCVQERDKNQRYLVMTYDSYEGIYIICKIKKAELLDLLQNRITMEETFRRSNHIIQTFIDDVGVMQYKEHAAYNFNDDLLPQNGEYLALNSRHIMNYIRQLT